MDSIKTVCLLEDFQQLSGINFNSIFLHYICRVGQICNFEICGALTQQKIYFLKNTSFSIADSFIMRPLDYINFYSDILCLFHSHPTGTADLSLCDIDNIQNCGIPCLIYSKQYKNFLFYSPITENKFIFRL